MAMLVIGSTSLPNPAKYKVTLQDLDSDNTTRSETGVMTRDRVRAGVYTIECSFKVNKTQLKTITDAIAAVSLSVAFFDPTTSSTPTKTMYVGNRSCDLLGYKTGAESSSLWELSFSLIQY
jgi:hypothetical protein